MSDPLRSRQQSGIRSARGLFGETPVRDQGFEGAGAGRGSPLQYRPSPPCLSRKGEKDGGGRATGHSAILRKPWPGCWELPRLNFPIRGVPKSSWVGRVWHRGPCRSQSLPRGSLASCPRGWGGSRGCQSASSLPAIGKLSLQPAEPRPRGPTWDFGSTTESLNQFKSS